MKTQFSLPSTPVCKVVYVKDSVHYQAIIPTPRDNEALQCAMLTRHVGMSQVKYVQALAPLKRN